MVATITLPQPISLGLERWELTRDAIVISHGIGPWKRTTAVPLEAIRAMDHEAADMAGAPRRVSERAGPNHRPHRDRHVHHVREPHGTGLPRGSAL